MLIENFDALKKYLVESLGRISDADPNALSRYIVALLKKPKSEDDLKVFFVDQLEIFLSKDTTKFVEQLFEAIKSKSYLPAKERENMAKQEKCDSSEKNYVSSDYMKSKIRESNQTEAVSLSRKNLSSSISSHSRSNSPEKNKPIFLKSKEAMSNKKYTSENSDHSSTNKMTDYAVQRQSEKLSKRCKDYDERGYCLLGDSCRFNHGSDPLIVEDVSVLNFAHVLNNRMTASLSLSEGKEAPLPPLPPPISPPPLPPPLPTSGNEYIPEPYNPECPAIEGKHGYGNYLSVSLQRSYQVPSLISSQTQLSVQTRVQNSKPVRSRELIGVPTVDCKKGENEFLSSRKRKAGFDFNRLGAKPKRIFSEPTNTLELRRIPPELNRITDLHDHFSSFGKIMNIQLCYDDDPEASLITFATAAEATAAYKSTEAVLNNRFIKVLLHDPNKKSEKKDTRKERYETCEKINEDNLSHSHTYTARDFHAKKTHYESNSYSKSCLSKTVFLNSNKADTLSQSSQSKGPKDEKKISMSKLDLYKKKQEFLDEQIQHQKFILERMKTTRSAKQRAGFKKIFDDIASKIKVSQNELIFFFEKEKCNSQIQKSAMADKRKEMLDAEIEMYKTSNKGDEHDTSLSLMKANELQTKGKEYGLLDSFEKSNLQHTKTHVHNYPSKSVSSFLKTDNRPKTLLVSGMEDKDCLVNFLEKYPDVEKVNCVPRGCTVVLNSRKSAEIMLLTLNGFKLRNETLSVSWFLDEQHPVSMDVKDTEEKVESHHSHDDEEEEEDDDDDDDEEGGDSEARSWRR